MRQKLQKLGVIFIAYTAAWFCIGFALYAYGVKEAQIYDILCGVIR